MPVANFGQWLPDQPAYSTGGSTEAKNVLPRSAASYGPLASLSSVSNAMSNRPQGFASFRDATGAVHTFAADLQDLFKYNSTSTDFDEVSSSSGAYTVPADGVVNFVLYGENVIAAMGHTDAIQSYVLRSSSAFATLDAAAPRAKKIGVVKDFVMAGDTYDGTDGSVANRVWWSAIDDPTDWPTIGSSDAANKQSDRQDLPVGGQVQAVVGAVGGMDGAVILEKALYRIQYEGPPTVFGFYIVENVRGTPAPNSVVSIGGDVYYLGEDGFYRFSGAGSVSIGAERIDKWFFSRLNQQYYHRVVGTVDAINKLIMWAFPSTDSGDGTPDTILIYNWALDRFSYAEVDCELIALDLTAGYTLEGLSAITSSIDALPFSLDSRVWKGGRLVLSAMDTSFKLARFAGSNLAAVIETEEAGQDDMVNVNGIRPFVDGGTITIGIKVRDLLTASPTLIGPNAIDSDGMAHFSKTTRYVRAQVNIAAGGTWNHAQGVTYDATPEGVL